MRGVIAASASGVVAVALVGSGLPFLVGSSVGFAASMAHTWKEESSYALAVHQ